MPDALHPPLHPHPQPALPAHLCPACPPAAAVSCQQRDELWPAILGPAPLPTWHGKVGQEALAAAQREFAQLVELAATGPQFPDGPVSPTVEIQNTYPQNLGGGCTVAERAQQLLSSHSTTEGSC